MTDPQKPALVDNTLLLRKEDFEELLDRAAERGTKRALADVGLDGDDAAHDIRELRGLLDAFNTAKHTAWQTVIKMITTGFLLALVAVAVAYSPHLLRRIDQSFPARAHPRDQLGVNGRLNGYISKLGVNGCSIGSCSRPTPSRSPRRS